MFERFSRTARIAVVLAQEEARELGSDEIRPEHLLVAVLQSAGHGLGALLDGHGITVEDIRSRLAADPDALDEQDAEALRTIGIDLAAVRDSVASSFGADAFDGASRRSGRRRRNLRFTRAAKKVLELALREALAHEDNVIGCEHLLLAIIRDGRSRAAGLLAERVTPEQLRTELLLLLDVAA